MLNNLITKTRNTWDDALIEHHVLNRMALMVPYVLILFLSPLVLLPESTASAVLVLLAKVLLTFQIARSFSALLNVSRSIYKETAKQKYVPLNAIIQVIKLALYLVTTIIIVSLIINRSPVYLLSGLGGFNCRSLVGFSRYH